MGRTRARNKHLPVHMYLRDGRYYWIGSSGGKRPCFPLGDDFATAMIRWRELEGHSDRAHTIAQMLDSYLIKAEVAEVTRAGYVAQSVQLKKKFKGFTPADVTPRHIRQYLSVRPRTAGAREIALFSAAWNAAREAGQIDLPNPREGIRIKGGKVQTRVANAGEQARLTEGHSQMAVICELALLTGLRQTDLRLLELSAITDKGLWVRPSKTARRTGKALEFELTPALRACLARARLLRRRVGSRYVFPTRTGEPYSLDGFQTMWDRHRKACGVPNLKFRDLRRTAVSDVNQKHGSDTARAFAAHGSVTTTERYTNSVEATAVRPTK